MWSGSMRTRPLPSMASRTMSWRGEEVDLAGKLVETGAGLGGPAVGHDDEGVGDEVGIEERGEDLGGAALDVADVSAAAVVDGDGVAVEAVGDGDGVAEGPAAGAGVPPDGSRVRRPRRLHPQDRARCGIASRKVVPPAPPPRKTASDARPLLAANAKPTPPTAARRPSVAHDAGGCRAASVWLSAAFYAPAIEPPPPSRLASRLTTTASRRPQALLQRAPPPPTAPSSTTPGGSLPLPRPSAHGHQPKTSGDGWNMPPPPEAGIAAVHLVTSGGVTTHALPRHAL
ncbi:hypothetical protein ZWY2020_023898 [Hordeum vulgare]|nr:hypothetical protein ZWY2020_023898 [Hordeum vulgare]